MIMETVTNGELTATAELDAQAANELRYGIWWLYETLTEGDMDETNASIDQTMVAAFNAFMSGGQAEVDSGFQLNGVNATVGPGMPTVTPMDALLGTLADNENETMTITMSQTLSFNVTDPGDSPTYFFEGDGADDDECLPVELNYRFVAPGEWVVASAEGTNITINIVNGVTAEFLLPAGAALPDVTITLEEQAPAPYDCEDAATHCISLNDDMTFLLVTLPTCSFRRCFVSSSNQSTSVVTLQMK